MSGPLLSGDCLVVIDEDRYDEFVLPYTPPAGYLENLSLLVPLRDEIVAWCDEHCGGSDGWFCYPEYPLMLTKPKNNPTLHFSFRHMSHAVYFKMRWY